MKFLTSLGIYTLFLTSCATSYHYQNEDNPNQFIGKNISVVQKKWGIADQTFVTRNGTAYYLYSSSSGKNFFYSTRTNFALLQNDAEFPSRAQFGLECSAVFKTARDGTIMSTSHTGSNCGGEWAPNR
ncbi:MAG TPA: hypothetical protein VLI69_07145 [Gammaproteobacteria bacterium]|nr:hypothetical protein [Gammaproteobacteria bacterium]